MLSFLVIGEQLLKSQSADSFLNMEIDSGIPGVPRSHSWFGAISSSQREMDTVSSHGPQMQEAFLSPLLSKVGEFFILIFGFLLGGSGYFV